MSAERRILLPGLGKNRPVEPLEAFDATEPSTIEPVGPWAADIDRVLAQARRQGMAEGRAEGFAAAEAAAASQLSADRTRLAAAVDRALDALSRRETEVESRMVREVAELALEIVGAILDREVSVADDPGAEAIARCLTLAPADGDLVARLHPDDAENVGQVAGLLDRQLKVVADPSLQPGDAIVTVDSSTIDARRSTAIERVRALLR